jgi:SAM-dependent methyltransferase
MTRPDSDQVREAVRTKYAGVANGASSCCAPSPTPTSSCCREATASGPVQISARLGYSAEELRAAPRGANLGLGCGNPQAIAALQPGERVLDLGSGAGFDCFLAARQVGAQGHVIGVDMTPEMIEKARGNAERSEFDNVEFRLGRIEQIPVDDDSVDVVMSNCVINLSPDKRAVFADSFRVLAPGGRLAIADVVATAELPEEMRRDLALHSACVSGAASIDAIEGWLTGAGFEAIRIEPKESSREIVKEWAPGRPAADYVLSATIEARKPALD